MFNRHWLDARNEKKSLLKDVCLCLFMEGEIITFRVHMSHEEKHVRCVQGERPDGRRRKLPSLHRFMLHEL